MAIEYRLSYTASDIDRKLGEVETLSTKMETKQDKLTFDSTPIVGSNNPVTSSGIYAALNTKQPVGDYALSRDIPNVPNWALQTKKPTYTAAEVGAVTEDYVDLKISEMVDSAPETLDTLNKLSAALGDDANFAATVLGQIGGKVDKVDGMGLSSNDFTDEEKAKLAGITEGSNNYVLPVANATTIGGVKSGTDITVDSDGNVSVNDDSHNHIISNIDGLQDALDAKQPVGDYALSSDIPLIYAWAKAETKPTYTADEVGALPIDTEIPDVSGQISTHNTATDSHNDIRLLIEGLQEIVDEKAASVHTHAISEVDSLQTALDAKATQADLTALETLVGTLPSGTTATSVVDYVNVKTQGIATDSSMAELQAQVEGKADVEHTHTTEDITDLASVLETKADSSHSHDDIYYTENEIDSKISEINSSIENITNGDVVVAKATHAVSSDSATSATSATKATQDANGNVIVDTYETKTDATAKLTEAKSYTDTQIAAIPTPDVSGQISAHNTSDTAHNDIRESISTLESDIEGKLSGKADSSHSHDDVYYTENEINTLLELKSDTTHNHDSFYDAKGSASSALAEAKTYAVSAAEAVKNDLLSGAGEAYDTLKELGDLINENVSAIEALETVATGKADKVHNHTIADVAELQDTIDAINEAIAQKNDTEHGQNYVAFDIEQSLTEEQKLQARSNIGIPETIVDTLAHLDIISTITEDDGDTIVDADGTILVSRNDDIFLPEVSVEDNDGVLKVVDGKWTVDTIEIPEVNYPVTSVNDMTGDVVIDIPEAVTIDSTLSVSGQAADAKAVGDKLAEKADQTSLDTLSETVSGLPTEARVTEMINAAIAAISPAEGVSF